MAFLSGPLSDAIYCSGTKHERSTLQLNAPGQGWLFAELLIQHPNGTQHAASGARLVMLASCEVTQGVGDAWAMWRHGDGATWK